MTLPSRAYAALAEDSYQDRAANPGKRETIEGRDYKVLATSSDFKSGYQGTIYQDVKSGELIVAHRGSEGGLTRAAQDWVGGNGNMVFNRTNPQIKHANELTELALDLAKKYPVNGHPAQVSTTGHSQGGTLAQVTAARYGLHGETFNAYGAASLNLDLPKGKVDIINHVRATDIVSAASKHLGEVRGYAINKDVADLRADGQDPRTQGVAGFAADIKKVGFDPHSVSQFHKQNSISGPPLLSDANRQTFENNKEMFGSFRHDIYQMRSVITNGRDVADWKLPKETDGGVVPDLLKREAKIRYDQAKQGLHDAGERVYDAGERAGQGIRKAGEKAGERLQEAGDQIRESVKDGWDRLQRNIPRISLPGLSSNDTPARGSPLLDDPGHSHNPMFKNALAGMSRIDANHGRPSDEATSRAAGALTAAAVSGNLKNIDQVVLGTDAKHLFAVEGDARSVHHNSVAVPTLAAMQQPLTDSTRLVDGSAKAQTEQRDVALAQQQNDTASRARSMG